VKRTWKLARAAVVALTIAAVGAPTASAGTIVPRRDGSKAVYVPADTTPDRATAEDGLQWDDAAFGAGAMAAFALASAAALSRRRHRSPGLNVEPTK
jgi:uncharacterized protein (TIGR03382 family)